MVLCSSNISSARRNTKTPGSFEVSLVPESFSINQRYTNLDYGLRIVVKSDVGLYPTINLTDLPNKDAQSFPEVHFDINLPESSEIILGKIASDLGFNHGGNPATDYILRVTISDFRLRVREYNAKKKIGSSSSGTVLNWELLDAQNNVVIPSTTSTGRGTANSLEMILNPLSKSLYSAFEGIDWDRIASRMKIAKTINQEGNKMVTGNGNTALEHSVIRWYIASSPQGADISWRIVSSTPDVANTNANYVGTTPYEATESFDIKGLTYNNSGNVQIEVTCEKSGYITQKKRFNP